MTGGFEWTGDTTRTVLMTLLTGGVTVVARLLWCMRDDVRDVKRDLHGTDGENGIKSDVRLLVQRVDAIEDRNIAIDAVNKNDRDHYRGPDRRAGARRMKDVVHEAFDERIARGTGEHPTSEE